MDFYFLYLLFFFISLAFVYFSGLLFTSVSGFRSGKFYTSVFLSLFSGLCITVILTSLIFTHGKTVNFGLIIIGILVVLANYKDKRNEPRLKVNTVSEKKPGQLLVVFAVLILVFSFRYFLVYNPDGIPFLPNSDTLFYANVSNYLGVSGVENISLDYLNLFPKSNDPYHYFDIWFNTAISRLFHLNALSCYILITISIFIFTCWFGFMAIAEQLNRVNVMTQLLGISFLIFSGVFLPFFGSVHILENANVFTVDLFSYPKLNVICLFLLVVSVAFITQRENLGLLILLAIPFVFVSTSLCIFSAVGIYLLRRFMDNKDLRGLIGSMVPVVFLAVFLFSFYTFGQQKQIFKIRNIDGGFSSFFDPGYLKTSVNIIGLTCIQLFIIYLPVFLILFFHRRLYIPYINPLKNNAALLVILIFLLSLLSWSVLHYMPDTVQLFSNITIMMLGILIFFLVVFISGKIAFRQRVVMYVVFGLVFVYKVILTCEAGRPPYPQSASYLKETTDAVKNLNPHGAFILNDSSYTSVFSKNPIFNIAGKHLAYANSMAFTYSLSVYNSCGLSAPTVQDTISMLHSVFYHFTEDLKAKGKFISIPRAQIEFINTYQIQYLIVERGVKLDADMESIVSSLIVDSATGERFYVLDRRKVELFLNKQL